MTHKLRFALTAVLLVALIGGGAGAAAADPCERQNDVDADNTTVVNDNDLVDADETLNDINANVLGITNQDSPVDVL